jgi:hypothetical protein
MARIEGWHKRIVGDRGAVARAGRLRGEPRAAIAMYSALEFDAVDASIPRAGRRAFLEPDPENGTSRRAPGAAGRISRASCSVNVRAALTQASRSTLCACSCRARYGACFPRPSRRRIEPRRAAAYRALFGLTLPSFTSRVSRSGRLSALRFAGLLPLVSIPRFARRRGRGFLVEHHVRGPSLSGSDAARLDRERHAPRYTSSLSARPSYLPRALTSLYLPSGS